MYNEAANAEPCIEQISAFLTRFPVRTGIVAVDDGSDDGTGAILASLARRHSELMIETHDPNRGYGASCTTGFGRVHDEGFDYALVMDADLTQAPEYIGAFYEEMRKGTDVIKATRYSKGGRTVNVPWQRRLVSWLGNRLARIMLRLPIHDYTNGFRAIRRDLLQRIECSETGFCMLIEEMYLAKKVGATFAEVPYTLTVRSIEGSRSKFVPAPSVFFDYAKYLFRK